MLFLTDKLNYITQMNNEIIKSFYAEAVLLLLQNNIGLTLRKRRHLPNR